MMLPRSSLRRIARAVLCASLFAQAALAAAACDWLRVAPAQALMAKAGEPSCHEEPARNANLCLAHCLGADQSTDTPQVAIPVWSQAFLLVAVDIESAPARQAILHYTLPHPGAPPPRILYHSFLI
ncbi:MAG: hypothetical protein AABM33_00610 [Pseudomonadota bacterium]